MKKVQAYKCDFCEKVYLSRSGATKHEARCWLNPARKSCATCGHVITYTDMKTYNKAWECLAVKDIIPFKQKIEGCREHTKNESGIFDDGME
ncbi:MAG: hypothetical protein ABIJ57_01895 [Pseudomonadota bacterium]